MGSHFARCFSAAALAMFLVVSICLPSALAQGAKRKSVYDSVEEKDNERPDLRSHWLMRGRTAPRRESAAALRYGAFRQKLAMRAEAKPTAGSTAWVSLGPAPLISDRNFYGPVSGRVSSIAIDPSDTTGNTVYAGSASGGVWKSSNAANPTAVNVTWSALTDQQASLVDGAVSVKPDGSVVLVGTGEPNNAVDSYYGIGILRSTNHGNSWTLISSANSGTNSFAGLGFAKFAWSTLSSNSVVAATGTTTQGFDDGDITGSTNRGLYLSTDSGQSWAFQTPQDAGVGISPASVSASDVVYNAVAGKFFAAIRYHGVYSSTNGQNWIRLVNQPNPAVLSVTNCPAQSPSGGSDCPIYRGQLAVVKDRNEMYFWFVSIASDGVTVVDEGIWRSVDGGNSWTPIDETGITNCGDPGNIGCAVDQGYYNLEIAAVADGAATDLYAGAVNLFKCKLLSSSFQTCATVDPNLPNQWINLTHAYGCSSIASVHPDQHTLDFTTVSGKAIMYFGNDGGIYRTLDGFTQLDSGTCGAANGFDNLNSSSVAGGTIGSLTQFVSFSLHPTDQNTVLGGSQGNGSPASSAAGSSLQWTTVNGGDGGYNAIDAWNPTTWYTANTNVNIYMCPSGINCTTEEFELTVGSEEVGGDNGAYYTPYILDPQDPDEMLVGTCRVWRGMPTVPPSSFAALSVDFDTLGTNTCKGEEINLVRALDAGGPRADFMSTSVYAATEGTGPNATTPWGGEVWVTTNAGITMMEEVTGSINPSHYTISSVAVDRSDVTGATAYVGVMGFYVSHVFRTTNAGASWTDWSGSGTNALPDAPVNALIVDSTAQTVYAGTDVGLFMTSTASASWSEVGSKAQPGATGYLPNAPITAIRIFNYGGTKKLRVSTYGRGIWEYALATAPDYTNVVSNTPQTVYPSQIATFNGTLTALNGYASPVNLSCTGSAPATCSLNPTQETPTATYTLTAGGAVGDYGFNTHAVGTDPQTITHDAAVVLHVVDFNLTAPNPNALTVSQGGTSSASTFQVTAAGSFLGTVTLSCPTGLPSGTSCVFSPSGSVNPTAGNPVMVTLTVAAASGTPVGGPTTVTLAANVAGAPAAKTQTFTLTITAAVPDFTLAVTATPGSTVAGQNIVWNGTLTSLHGYHSSVTLSCAGRFPDTCILNPASLVPTASGAAFTATVGSSTAGNFSFNVQGTDGTLTHIQAVNLTVGTDVLWANTGNSSVTVEAGQSAVYSFSAAPVGAATFSGAVTFACAGLPALTNCSFSPSSIVAGAGTTAVTLTISTIGPYNGSSSPRRQGRSRNPAHNFANSGAQRRNVVLLWATILLTGICLIRSAPAKAHRRNMGLAWVTALAILAMLAACGGLGGGGGQPPPQVTVTVSPRSVSIYADEPDNTWPPEATRQQFTAVVNNGGSQAVTWAVSGGDGNGTIDANGLYHSPSVTPSPASVTVTATSTEAPQPGTATVTIETPTPVGTWSVSVSATAAGGSGHSSPVTLVVD